MNYPSRRRSLFLYLSCFSLFLTLSWAQNTYQGCYAIDNTLVLNDTNTFQSTGRCSGTICGPQNYAVFGLTSGSQCWCGNKIPADQVTGDHCSISCPGYPSDICGGTGYIGVWLTGLGKLEGSAASVILSASSIATPTSAPSNTVYVTTGQTTIIQAPSQTGNSSKSGGGVSGGAAAGIVIAVLLIVGGAAGAFFFIRRRRRDAYQKQYEGSNFSSSPGSLNRPFGTDQRLEPGMVQKRESVGSLADEQDYSRKILRVTNPDGT